MDTRLERTERGALREKSQVRLALAIRGAEARKRDRAAHCFAKDSNPRVLAARRVMGVPELLDPKNRPQVIDVPVTLGAVVYVTRDPGADAAGTERASDVHVIPASNRQDGEAAHRNLGFARRPAHERVSPWTWPDASQG